MTDLLKLCDNKPKGGLPLIAALPPPLPPSPRLRRTGRAFALLGLEASIAEAARSWLGTPFKHQGRMKGVGVDCLGLLVGVALKLDLKDKSGEPLVTLDRLGYGHFPDEIALQSALENALHVRAEPCIGAIGLFTIDGRTQHLGIFGDYGAGELSLIHAYAPHRKVVEHRLSEEWLERVVGCYRLCEVTEAGFAGKVC